MALPADFPESLMVGHTTYDVQEYTPEDPDEEGEFHEWDRTLSIADRGDRHHKLVTLFHEWWEAQLMHNGQHKLLDSATKEMWCDMVGYAVADLFQQGLLKFCKPRPPDTKA